MFVIHECAEVVQLRFVNCRQHALTYSHGFNVYNKVRNIRLKTLTQKATTINTVSMLNNQITHSTLVT